MNKCAECNATIFESRQYRVIKQELIKLDERFAKCVNDLCLECLRLEKVKFLRKKRQKELIEKVVKENKIYENN